MHNRNGSQRTISLLEGIGEEVGQISIGDAQGRPKEAMSHKEIVHCPHSLAFINHFLALDFERAAKEEKNRAVALARLKAGLERAEIAIKTYGEFNPPGQGTPTRTLAESLRKQIADMEQPSK